MVYKLSSLAAVIGIFLSIGSLGGYLHWSNPSWKELGVNPTELRSAIQAFPEAHCGNTLQPLCRKFSDGVLWFLGL